MTSVPEGLDETLSCFRADDIEPPTDSLRMRSISATKSGVFGGGRQGAEAVLQDPRHMEIYNPQYREFDV